MPGDSCAVIETYKVTIDFEAQEDGAMAKYLVKARSTEYNVSSLIMLLRLQISILMLPLVVVMMLPPLLRMLMQRHQRLMPALSLTIDSVNGIFRLPCLGTSVGSIIYRTQHK